MGSQSLWLEHDNGPTLWLGQNWEVTFGKVLKSLTTFPTQDMCDSSNVPCKSPNNNSIPAS